MDDQLEEWKVSWLNDRLEEWKASLLNDMTTKITPLQKIREEAIKVRREHFQFVIEMLGERIQKLEKKKERLSKARCN